MATSMPPVKSVCLATKSLVLLLILVNIISDEMCETASLDCPSVTDGSITKLNCYIPTSACPNNSVWFKFEINNGPPDILCQTKISTSCVQQVDGDMQCGCLQPASGDKYYQLNFKGNKTIHDQGKLTCYVNCAQITEMPICQPITFALPSTSPSTTTVKSAITTSRSPSATTSSYSSSTDEKAASGGSSGNSMHVWKTGIIASMSGIIACISTYLK